MRFSTNWTFWLSQLLVQRLSPRDLVDLGVAVWPLVRGHIPQEQRVDFLKNAAEKHLAAFLEGLSRDERAALMNALLPLIAREFPLADLDFLAAFPSTGNQHQTEVYKKDQSW
jgi:hypothetical protein